MTKLFFVVAAVLIAFAAPARAEDIGCVDTAFKLFGPNHKVCVYAFDDPEVPGVACHISQAKTGGFAGGLGLAEDPSNFSLACRQVGPIDERALSLPNGKEVFSERTSFFFKQSKVVRMVDKKRRTLVYLDRDSPDESRSGVNVPVFLALLQGNRDVRVPPAASGSPTGCRGG